MSQMMQSVILYGVHRAVSEPLAVSPVRAFNAVSVVSVSTAQQCICKTSLAEWIDARKSSYYVAKC
jgi:hypothetical protein